VTVYARGYRTYDGSLRAPPAALAIAYEGAGRVLRSRAFRRIGTLYLLWFAICAVMLYLSVGMGQTLFRGVRIAETPEAFALLSLDWVLRLFYTGVSYVTALLAVFVGSGLIADDLHTGALPLYLVRPLRAWDYVVGKALVLPVVLLGALLVPGLFLWTITGMWRPPGETWPFLVAHLDVAGRVVEYYLVTAAAYTGLTLLLSSRSPRRAAVAILAAAVIFGGVLLQIVGIELHARGVIGDALRLAGLPHDTTAPFIRATPSFGHGHSRAFLPSPEAVRVLAACLFAVGLFFAWRRARSVEVTS